MKKVLFVFVLCFAAMLSYAKDKAGFERALVEYTEIFINQIKEFEIQHPYERDDNIKGQFLKGAFAIAEKYKYKQKDVIALYNNDILFSQCQEKVSEAYDAHVIGVEERRSRRDAEEKLIQIKRNNDFNRIQDATRNLGKGDAWRGIHGKYSMKNIYIQLYGRIGSYRHPRDQFFYTFIGEFDILVNENKRFAMTSGQEKWIKDTGDILHQLYSNFESGSDYKTLADMAYDLALLKFGEYL